MRRKIARGVIARIGYGAEDDRGGDRVDLATRPGKRRECGAFGMFAEFTYHAKDLGRQAGEAAHLDVNTHCSKSWQILSNAAAAYPTRVASSRFRRSARGITRGAARDERDRERPTTATTTKKKNMREGSMEK